MSIRYYFNNNVQEHQAEKLFYRWANQKIKVGIHSSIKIVKVKGFYQKRAARLIDVNMN